MPFPRKKTDENEETPRDAKPGKLSGYLAALHTNDGDKAAKGGIIVDGGPSTSAGISSPYPDEGLAKQMKYDDTEKKEIGDAWGDNYAQGGIINPYPMTERSKQMRAEQGTEGSYNETKDVEYDPMKTNFDDGGFPGISRDDSTKHFFGGTPDVSLPDSNAISDENMNLLQPQGAGMLAPSASPAPTPVNQLAPAPQQPPVVAQKPVPAAPNAPQGGWQDALQQYLAQQKAGTEKYGPEEQIATQNAILQRQRSPGSLVGQGLAGMGDAIMQGVARAGNPGFLSALQNRQKEQGQAEMGTMEKAQTGKMAQLQAQMKLSMDDPGSALSKVAQQSEAPTLAKLGWTPEQIKSVSANTIGEATKNNLDFYESQQKAELAKATLGQTATYESGMLKNTATGLANTAANEKAQRAQQARDEALKENVEASKHYITHPIQAFKAGQAISQGSNAPNSFDSEAEAEAANLPQGTIVTIGGRQARVK